MGLRDRPQRWRPAVLTCAGWMLCCVLVAALVAWPGRAEPSVARARSPAARAAARNTNYRTRNVFVISIDGLRATEAFGAANPDQYIPNMNRLRQSGSLYRNVYNLGATWPTPANYTIVDGCWELTAPSEYWYRRFRPTYPTMFEYYRFAHPEVRMDKVWTVPGLRFTEMVTCSSHALFGVEYAASGETISRPPFDPWRPDLKTWEVLQARMDQYHPSLVFANFGGLDLAADNFNEYEYRQAIPKVDRIIGQLWDKIQGDEQYRDQTTLLVTASYGRRDDENGVTNPDPVFGDIPKGTGGISEGCKHVFVLALGPDIRAGAEFTETRQLTDICPTVGELLGFDTPLAQGRVLSEMIASYQPHTALATPPSSAACWQDETRFTNSPGLVEQPRVAINGLGLHVVWVDSRSGQREVYYKLRSPDGAWSADQELSTSGSEARAPAIAVDGDTVHVVWQDYREGQWAIYYSQRSSDGRWSPPGPVAHSVLEGTQGNGNPQMVWEPAVTACGGQVSVAVPVSRYWLRVYHGTGNGSWRVEPVVDSTNRVDRSDRIALPQHPRMVSDGSHSYLLWQEVHKITWKLMYKRSASCAGGWGTDLPLPTQLLGGNEGSIAVHGSQVTAAWIVLPYALWSVEPSDLMRNQSANAGVSWDPRDYGRGPGNGQTMHSTGCRNADLAAAAGLTALVWEDYRVPGRLPVIYLSRSSDNGATWQEQPVSFGSDWSVEPSVATDGRTAYVVWRDRRDGTWQLYLARLSDVEPSPTPTLSPTSTATPTATPSATQTPAPTSTATNTPVELPTATSAPSHTPSATATWTPITVATLTRTGTPTQTATPSRPTYGVYLPIVTGFETSSSPGILHLRFNAGSDAPATTRRWLRTELRE